MGYGAQVAVAFLAIMLAWAIIGGIRDARRQARARRRRPGYLSDPWHRHQDWQWPNDWRK